MLLYYLRCRLLQFLRAIKEVGLGYLLLGAPLLLVFLLAILEKLRDYPHPIVPAVIGFLVFSLHLRRQDAGFLQKLPVFLPLLFFAEYLLYTTPIGIALLCFGLWHNALWLLLALCITALVPPRPRITHYWQHKLPLDWFPDHLFECKAGMRRGGVLVFFIYIIGLSTSYWIAPPLIVLFLLAISAASCYEHIEDKEIVEQWQRSSNFLMDKVLLLSFFFWIATIPIGAAFLIFHFAYWYLLLFVLLVCQTILLFAVCYKYAQYHPHRSRVYASMPLTLFSLFMLIPFLLPVGIGFCVWYWRRASWNMLQFV